MTSSSRWTSKFTTGWRTVDGHPGETSGWPGCMEKRHDILRKASPRLKETEEYFMPGSLPVQPQVTMGSGLVDLSCDSGWDGASRCRTTVGLDEHRKWSGELFGRPCFGHLTLKHPEVRERKERDRILRVKCTNLCRGLKPNRLAVSPVTDNLSLWTWIYLRTLNTGLIT